MKKNEYMKKDKQKGVVTAFSALTKTVAGFRTYMQDRKEKFPPCNFELQYDPMPDYGIK